jgi:hypothetical protein
VAKIEIAFYFLVQIFIFLPNMGKKHIEPANPKPSDVRSGGVYAATGGHDGMQTRRQSKSRHLASFPSASTCVYKMSNS